MLRQLIPLILIFTTTVAAESVRELDWTELMPEHQIDALSNPPKKLNEIPEGSSQDQTGNVLDRVKELGDETYYQALTSSEVVPDLAGKQVRLPGFIVPLEHNSDQYVTRFLLVPYFGACIHLPPPPPNQTIMVHYSEGVSVPRLYRPYWVTGVLQIEQAESELGASSYRIDPSAVTPYSE